MASLKDIFKRKLQPITNTLSRVDDQFRALPQFIDQKSQKYVPGGISAGVNRVRSQDPKEYFLPTSTKKVPYTNRQVGQTFQDIGIKPLTNAGKSLYNLSPARMYERAYKDQLTPRGLLSDVANVGKGVGALTLGPIGYAGAGLLGAGISSISGGGAVEGALQGVEMGQQYGGLSRFTNPAISKFAPSSLLAGRIGQGVLNVGEGIAMDEVAGNLRPVDRLAGAGIDFVTGMISPSFNRPQTRVVPKRGWEKAIEKHEEGIQGLMQRWWTQNREGVGVDEFVDADQNFKDDAIFLWKEIYGKSGKKIPKRLDNMVDDVVKAYQGYRYDKQQAEFDLPDITPRFAGDAKGIQPPLYDTFKNKEFTFVRNSEKSVNMGSRFGQDIEPAGKYMNLADEGQKYFPPGWETGKVKFKNPLVIDWGGDYQSGKNWKNVLSQKYDGKTGKELSQAIAKDGYDGIITLDGGKPSEVVSLKDFNDAQGGFGEPKKSVVDQVIDSLLPNNNITKMGFADDLGPMRQNTRPGSYSNVRKADNPLYKESDDILKEARKQVTTISKKKSLKQSTKDFYTDWVNRTQPIEDLEAAVEKNLNAKIIPENSPSYAVKRLMGAGGKAELRHQQKLQPILDTISDIPKEDFDVFLKARRDVELGQRGIKGSNSETANSVIVALGNKYDLDKMNEAAKQLYAYQKENLEMLRKAGFLDDEKMAKITDLNKQYVPFKRIMDDVDEYLGLPTNKLQQSSSPIKKIKGSDRPIESPLEQIIANTYRTEAAVAKNRVAKSIVNLKQILPTLSIKKVKPKTIVIKEADGKAGFRKVTKNAFEAPPNAIVVWENGKKSFYEVPEDISKVVKGLNEETMDTMTKILSAPAKILRQQATGRNLEFMIPNAFRDQFDAAINSEYGYKPFIGYLQGMAHLMSASDKRVVRKVGETFGGDRQIVEDWINSGGKMFFENMSGMKAISEQTNDATKKRFTKKLIDWATGGIDTIGKYSESPTRVGLYKNAFDKTGNKLIAARESREATLDFARRGARMKTANALVPFLNVGVQGFDRMIRTVKNNPGKATLALLGYGAVPSTAVALYNNLYHAEDWQKVPDYIKQDNFVFLTGARDDDGNPKYFTFPKSHVQKFAANPVQEFITYAAGNNPQGFKQFALNFFGESLPIVEGGDSFTDAASKTIGSNLPQAFKPGVQTVANYDFFRGKNIVPWYLEKKDKPEQTTKYTEEVYNKLGTVFNISPLKIKNFLETSLAGGVKQPVNLYKTVDAVANGEEVSPSDVFIARRFFTNASGYDLERPEPTDTPGFFARLKSTTDEASASTEIPTNDNDFKILYEDALRTVDGYADKSSKIRTGLTDSQTLPEAQKELVDAKNLLRRMEQEQPEKIFKIGLDTYKSGGSKTTEERARWVAEQIGKTKDEKELNEKYLQMLESGVVTKSVLKLLKEAGFKGDKYIEGGKVKTMVSSSGGRKKKAPVFKISKLKRQSARSTPRLKRLTPVDTRIRVVPRS